VFGSNGPSASLSLGKFSSWIGSAVTIPTGSTVWSRRGLVVFGWIRMLRPEWFSQGTIVGKISFANASWNTGRSCGPTFLSCQLPSRTRKRSPIQVRNCSAIVRVVATSQ
jgi:hypothetical protein